MPREPRQTPLELTPGWPDIESPDPVAEVARQLALNLRAEIGDRSVRDFAASVEVAHGALLKVLAGKGWPSGDTLARIERALGKTIWPGVGEVGHV